MDLYYQARAFQGHEDSNHGNIHNVGFNHRTILGARWDILYGYEYSVRKEKQHNEFTDGNLTLADERFRFHNGYIKAVLK